MKICFLTRSDFGGGTRRSLELLRKYLWVPSSVEYVGRGWRPHERYSSVTFLFFLLFFAAKLPQVVGDIARVRRRAVRYDIVHVNHESLIWYAIGLRRPVVCHVRNMWPRSVLALLFRWLVLAVADRVVCISPNESWNNFRNHYKCHVVYNIAS